MNLRRIAPEAALIGAGQAVAALASLATIRVMTGILRPEVYGQLGLALTVAMLAQQCVLGPIAMAAARYYAPACDGANIRGYLRGVGILCAAGTLALGVITAAMAFWISGVWIAAAYAWTSSISSLVDGIQNAARQRALVAVHQSVGGWLRLALAAGAARLWGGSSAATLCAYAAGYLVLSASQCFFLWRNLRSAREREITAAMTFPLLNYAWPFAAWGVFTWIQASADRWSINAYCGLYQTGLYQSLYQLGYYPASLLSQFLLQIATPIFFAKAGHGEAEHWNRRLVLGAIGGTLLAGAVSAAGGHKLLALLLAPGYRAQSALLTPLILASGFFAAGQIGALDCMMSMNTRRLIAPKIVTALGGAALLLAGAAIAGTKGVVAAQLCFSCAYLAWILMLNRRAQAPAAVPTFALNG